MSEVIYRPSVWGQEFHDLKHNEALGAGTAGVGKSWVLLMDPIYQVALEHQRCVNVEHPYPLRWGESKGWALYLRRTTKMLDLMVNRAKTVFPRIDPRVRFLDADKTFVFSSGYRYQFGHCHDPDDWQRYQGNEYCMAKGEPVLMADGSHRPIELVRVGEMVQTLEGPRAVTAVYSTGIKPCVRATTEYQGETVGTQVHPTTHPVLVPPIAGYTASPSQDCSRTASQCQPLGCGWLDYESLLDGLAESPVKRASRLTRDNGFAKSDGSRLALEQLPALCVPVVLHEPSVRRAAAFRRRPTESGSCGEPQRRSGGSTRARWQPLLARLSGLRRRLQDALRTLANGFALASVDGAAYGPLGPETTTGSLGYCSLGPRLHGARPLPPGGIDQGCAQRPVGAEEPIRPGMSRGAPGSAPECTPVDAGTPYGHFYTGERRASTTGTRMGSMRMEFAGWLETYDLTINEVNHYINPNTGLVNCQTYIGFDELVQFMRAQYDQIRSRLRVGDPLLKDMLKVRAMSNPTQVREVGEDFSVDEDPYWVRKRFVDRCPEGRRTYYEVLRDMDGSPYKWSWVYLPGKLEDNPDPEFRKQYWRTLSSMPEHIRKALRDGDWYVVAGAFYAEAWEPRLHIIDPFPIPTDWGLSRSMDWGYRKPGVVHWWAHSPDGVLFCIREYKFRGKRAESVARRIKEIELELGCWSDGRSQITGPADTQLWEERGEMAKSKASTFKSMGISWKRADKKSRKNNAERLLIRLRDHDHGTRDPAIVFFKTCRDIVRTLPAIPADKDDPEEPAKGGDDHAHDSVLYACAYASRHNGTVTSGDKRRSKDEEDEEEEKARAPKRGRLGYGT